jgi:hypothetical protein
MSYVVLTIDRRAEYYARAAALIAADPLGFYTRAETGRRIIAARLSIHAMQPANIVAISDARRKSFPSMPTLQDCTGAGTDAATLREAAKTR